ncbi:glycosyltransferase [Bacillus mycoides]|uniref:glycosyltransferase n=2 Tax=Bacillus mycoides TaxID=1405 RepID=UPI001F34000F|nr:glycosyltransferase [Bacillus mycoides]
MMKILFIATQLPPFIGSANIRALNYINYLNRLGHDLDVITVDYPKDSIAYDKSSEDVFDKEVRVHRVNPGLLYNVSYTKKSSSDVSNNPESSKLSFKRKIGSFVKRNILIPDAFLQWINPAYRRAVSLIENNGMYDCIFSMHETPSSHIVAYKIKKKFPNLKWVGYWSDPWNGDSLRKGRSLFKAFLEEKIERNIVSKVDKFFFTTNSTREMYIDKYKLDPNVTNIIYRGYDDSLYQDIEKEQKIPIELKNSKINIVHTGTIYKELRDINPLCNALEKLKNENYNLFKKIHVLFIGQFTDIQDENRVKNLENVTIKSLMPYKEALRYVVYADALLLYGNQNSTQVPGKVYEYLGSKATVLTILGDEKDELRDLMEQVNKGPIILNTEDCIFNTIQSLENRGASYQLDWHRQVTEYKWINVVKDLENKMSN